MKLKEFFREKGEYDRVLNLFGLCTSIILFLFWMEFLTQNNFLGACNSIFLGTTPPILIDLYLNTLWIYAGFKESMRWAVQLKKEKRGILFFWAWVFSAVVMGLVQYKCPTCHIPSRLMETVETTILVLVVTRASKGAFKKYGGGFREKLKKIFAASNLEKS